MLRLIWDKPHAGRDELLPDFGDISDKWDEVFERMNVIQFFEQMLRSI
jgi:hypothetical protein